jgi:ribosomal protein S18 acetylase RimI-like enzyme
MGSSPIVVRPAVKADARELSRVLALAFEHDPPMIWMFPDPASRRRRQLRRMFLTLFRREVCARGGARVAADGGRIVGAALSLPPRAKARTSKRYQVMMLAGLLWAFGRRFGYLKIIGEATAEIHPKEPHWYLFAIGVDPSHQGMGVGAALLRERLRHIDTERLPAYLESSSLANVPMYEHFGFENTGTVPLPEDAPVLTSMWRTPQR